MLVNLDIYKNMLLLTLGGGQLPPYSLYLSAGGVPVAGMF